MIGLAGALQDLLSRLVDDKAALPKLRGAARVVASRR
jgi:hypothetical protein